MSIIARINRAVELQNAQDFLDLASNPGASIEDVIKENIPNYLRTMKSIQAEKLLNHGDIQEVIDTVNNNDFKKIEAVRKVNEAVEKCDAPRLRIALLDPELNLGQELGKISESLVNDLMSIGDDEAIHLLCMLRDLKANLSMAESEDQELWMNHIVEVVTSGLGHGREAQRAGTALAIVNMAVMQGDSYHTFQTLLHEDLGLHERLHDEALYRKRYQEELAALAEIKSNEKSPWIVHNLSGGDKVYLNLREHSYAWRTPSDYRLRSPFLSSSDIDVVSKVNSEADGRLKFEASLVKLQARVRGYLVRQRLFSMLQHYYENEDKIAKIQALWRGRKVRARYSDEIEKMAKTRLRAFSYYKKYENHIRLIQRVWRARRAKNEFRKLLESNNVHKNMDVPTVRKFLHLLDLRPEDFAQELELQNLKGEITKKIRLIQGLEKDLDTMDIKIGLLVKNRIDMEEVVAHGNHLTKRLKDRNNHHHHQSGGTFFGI